MNPVRRIEILSLELTKRVLKHITFIALYESARNVYTSSLLDQLVYIHIHDKQNQVYMSWFVNTNGITWLSPLAHSSRVEKPTSSPPTTENNQTVIPYRGISHSENDTGISKPIPDQSKTGGWMFLLMKALLLFWIRYCVVV